MSKGLTRMNLACWFGVASVAIASSAWAQTPASRTSSQSVSSPAPNGTSSPTPQNPTQLTGGVTQSAPQRVQVSVRTDKGLYRPGERPVISGRMLFGNGFPATGFVRVNIYEMASATNGLTKGQEPVRYDNILDVRAGDFKDDGFVIPRPIEKVFQWSTNQASYGVWVRAITNSNDSQAPATPTSSPTSTPTPTPTSTATSTPVSTEEAYTAFQSQETGIGSIFVFILGSVATLIYVLVMVQFAFLRTPTKAAGKTMLFMTYMIALVCLALPFLAPLVISSSSDLETLLRTTPVGFLKAPAGTPAETQWLVNIGGVLTANGELKGGVAIPLLILVLSLVGAAINMLRKLPHFLNLYEAIPNGGVDVSGAGESGEDLRAGLFQYFVYILVSPFIAMTAYCLMNIVNYTNTNALMIVAFSVGFISDSVVEAILSKAESLFGGKPAPAAAPVTAPAAAPVAASAAAAVPAPLGAPAVAATPASLRTAAQILAEAGEHAAST